MKNKFLMIILIVIFCICVFSGCSVSTKVSKFLGVYVCENDNKSFIELTDFNIPSRKGIITYHHISIPSYGLKGYSQNKATAKVFKRKGRCVLFHTSIGGKELTGSLNVDKKQVNLDGIIYIKKEF